MCVVLGKDPGQCDGLFCVCYDYFFLLNIHGTMITLCSAVECGVIWDSILEIHWFLASVPRSYVHFLLVNLHHRVLPRTTQIAWGRIKQEVYIVILRNPGSHW